MNSPFILKTAAPTIIISGLLLALGIAAAWNVQRLQMSSSELIAREVHGMIAAQDLYIDMREIRHQLQQFGRSKDPQHLVQIRKLIDNAPHLIERANTLVITPQEDQSLKVVASGWQQFLKQFEQFEKNSDTNDAKQLMLLDQLLLAITKVIGPAREHLVLNRDVVDTTNETNRRTNEQLRQAFLLLGICGSAAGLVAGLVFAKGISRSIVQLDVSVRGAAGRLQDVVGPFTISRIGGFSELEAGLHMIESHVGTLIERLQQREREVLRSEQLAAVGQLASGMAHELRNPLMPMKMLVQAAIERNDGSGLTGQQLHVVEAEIVRLEKSIQEFLDFARPPLPQKRRINVREAIEQTIELVSGRAERQKIDLKSIFSRQSIEIEADSIQLKQVFLNLILNSFDSLSESGGQVCVSLSECPPPGDSTLKHDSANGKWIHIEISDSGSGIPQEVLDRVFEPFVSTKESGTGLGLSICHRIVSDHGGVITASNGRQGGAHFSVYLPATSDGLSQTD